MGCIERFAHAFQGVGHRAGPRRDLINGKQDRGPMLFETVFVEKCAGDETEAQTVGIGVVFVGDHGAEPSEAMGGFRAGAMIEC